MDFSQAAPYLLTHAQHRRMITGMNLRECYRLPKLRNPQTHDSIREPMNLVLRALQAVHPTLFDHPSPGL